SLFWRITPNARDGAVAQEVGFIKLDKAFKVGGERIGQAVGVLPDDDVRLFQAQNTLGFDAERSNAKIAACGQELLPHVAPIPRGAMDFIRKLACEADA